MNFFLLCGVRQGAKILQVRVEVSEGDAQMAKMCPCVGVKGRDVLPRFEPPVVGHMGYRNFELI